MRPRRLQPRTAAKHGNVVVCRPLVKQNQPLLHAQVKAPPWRQVPGGATTRGTGRLAETRSLKAAHVSRLTSRTPGRPSRSPAGARTLPPAGSPRDRYAVTSLTSAQATARIWPGWSASMVHRAHHPSGRDLRRPSASRTGSGPSTWPPSGLASPRPSRCNLHIEATRPPSPPRSTDSTAPIRTATDIHGTRRSPGGSAARLLARPSARLLAVRPAGATGSGVSGAAAGVAQRDAQHSETGGTAP